MRFTILPVFVDSLDVGCFLAFNGEEVSSVSRGLESVAVVTETGKVLVFPRGSVVEVFGISETIKRQENLPGFFDSLLT